MHRLPEILKRPLELLRGKRPLVAVFVAIATLTAIAPHPAYAFLDIGDIAQSIVAKIFFGIAAIVTFLAGIVIAIESWFLQIILNLNMNLVNSTPVKIGFPIVLAFANLAFVAGIIIIAIATILRQDRYGIKKILWKLVVMAVLVNFGLVICGSLLQVSDQVTRFFVNSVDPSGNGSGGSGGDFGTFVTSLAGAFNPQDSFIGPNDLIKNPFDSTSALDGFAKAGQDIAKFLLPISSLLATLGALTIIIITLGVMIVMLLIRYVKLGMLLIILPLAWTSWIFPAYESHYKTWWDKFTKNAIFPPVMMFFLWLSLKISEIMSQKTGEYEFTQYQSDATNGAWAAIATFFTNIFSPQIEQLLRIFIVWGLMMGGLVAAQDLGIKFADVGTKAVNGVGNWAKGKATRIADSRVRNIGKRYDPKTKETTTALQRFGSKLQGVNVKGSRWVPGSRLAAGLVNSGVQLGGQVIAKQGDTRKRYDDKVEKERKDLESLTNEGLIKAAAAKEVDPILMAAKAQELARRKLLDPASIAKLGNGNMAAGEEVLKKLVRGSELMGSDQALYNVRPELVKYSDKVERDIAGGKAAADAIKDAIVDAVKKIPAGEANKISAPSLGSQVAGTPVSDELAATFLNLGNSHFAKIGAEGTAEQQAAVRNTFDQLLTGATASGRLLTVAEIEQVERIRKHLTNNSNWSYP